ncbi:hypothetical protein C7M84_002896 [Penaeus vannamei]|uniref:Uncharacterized protein n=1 Tax=Penaeus vannamei TaxID=6689 RepID=A0A423TPJ9_PENVA|nr:hypothetical protein C7M84_002896 [Penaeus vannamei]
MFFCVITWRRRAIHRSFCLVPQQVECQTRVDECPGGALASLAPELEAAPPLLPPPLASSSPRPKSASPLLNGVRVQSDRFLFDDKDSLARADAFLPQGDASSRKGSYGLAAPDALPHADGRGLGADRMPRQEMSIYALPPEFSPQMGAKALGEFPPAGLALSRPDVAESYALPAGAALLQAPRPLCHPAKPAPQVIYHGQPHLQQQLEQQSQEHSLGARCQCGHEQQPLQTCLQLSSSYSSLNPARLAAHDACFDDSCHQTLDLPGGCSSLGPGRSCLKSPQRTCTLQRSHSAHEPYVCPPGGPPAQAKAEACSLCGNAGGGAPPPYHNPRNCVSNVCFMYGSSGFQTVF